MAGAGAPHYDPGSRACSATLGREERILACVEKPTESRSRKGEYEMIDRVQRASCVARTSNNRARTSFVAWMVCLVTLAGLVLPISASAQSSNAMIKEQLERIPTGEAGNDQIMTPMAQRLELSSDQVGEIRPIVSDMVGNFESAKGKFEAGEYTVMKMMMEMNVEGEKAATLVEAHLSEKQLAEYKAMRTEQKMRMMEERQKAMREMMKARQAAAAEEATP